MFHNTNKTNIEYMYLLSNICEMYLGEDSRPVVQSIFVNLEQVKILFIKKY